MSTLRCNGCRCEMHEFEQDPYCQLCEILLIAGWGWLKKNCPSVLEQAHDPDALCHRIGNEVVHAERMTYKNEMLNKKVFCMALELEDLKRKKDPPPPIHGDHI